MKLTRRKVIQGGASATLSAALTQPVWAQTTLQADDRTLNTLSDGNLVLPKSFAFGGTPPEGADELLARYGITGDSMTPDCNVTLLRSGDRTILFDVGAGQEFMPSAGKLLDAFDTLGVDIFDVTDVVFTHAHPDHLWGVRDDFGDLMFPDATYHMGRAEWDYWTDPDTVSTIDEGRVTFAVGAQSRLELLAEQINLFEDDQEILPGVLSRMTPGHTPGHMAFEVQMGSESIMILGDSIVNHHIAFEKPAWLSGSDQDPELGVQTRLGLLDQLSTSQMRLIGFHLPGGGLGRAERRGDGFVFVGEET
ncbi:glyoxylase-like metal-dependent hydrolase (beta-lactamase superfamily II) [Loktanella sp. PT4BL]|jgi:glyoxylase-like metal-dependent hydrolase (beta-lactamase superfamily II)|uniref:MBL fold metallo-hydrolase n=1 Tax=Loktanella sp. PT4BL TaxID=2135611 RepID=UPI000D752741|nr:MBL fold metallo-hydrolase [Loktanella sp. PT4BL]PXW72871.1 glyoxylase-like metal-dependent hydrolase (beta-lactamase superfamily II) [Loktanella sp. PT4BL]